MRSPYRSVQPADHTRDIFAGATRLMSVVFTVAAQGTKRYLYSLRTIFSRSRILRRQQ
jgi:hypothetical protein